jgi:protocatechuate 3,4-dioxygenase beta subunit
MAEGADPPPPRPPGTALRMVVLVLIGAAVASAVFWIARREPAPQRREAIIDTGPAAGPKTRKAPDLPAPRKGPGNERLAGIVVDGAGAAVGGVHVTAELEPGEGGKAAASMPAVVAIADARGAFALEGLVPGRYRLRVEGPDIVTGELRFVPVPTDEARVVVAREVRVEGKVTDGGKPVAKAHVYLVGDAIAGTLEAESSGDGGFAFTGLPEGSYQVWAVAKDDLASRAQRALRLGAGPFPPIELRVEPAAVVVGQVVERGTTTPVAAEIAVRSADTAEPPRFARTGPDGQFRVAGVPQGRWTLDAYAPGWIPSGALAFEAGRAPLVVELEPGGMIEGTITDSAGRPIADAEVQAVATIGGEARVASAITEDDRLREMAGAGHAAGAPGAPTPPGADPRFVPRGELGVLLGPIPFVSAVGGAGARQAAPVAVTAPGATGSVTSPLTAAAAPPPPLPVDPARAPIWITGPDGRYRIPGLGAGAWTVIARAPDYAEARSRPTTLAPGDTATVDLVLSPGLFLAGTVTDSRGDTLIGATVTIERAAPGSEELIAVTDETGAYRLGPVAGAVRVRASAYGHVDATRELALPATTDAARDEKLDLVLVAADAAIEGELDDPTGLPVAGAELSVGGAAAGDVTSGGRRATTDKAGRFRIAGLPPGPVRLHAIATGFPPQDLDAQAVSDVKLVLALGGGIDGLVFDHHTGEPIPGVAITATGPGGLREDAESGGDGRFTIAPIVPGAWRLQVALAGYLPVARAIDVPVADHPGVITARDQRVELERGATLGGVVRDQYGSRLPGATVTVRRRGAP